MPYICTFCLLLKSSSKPSWIHQFYAGFKHIWKYSVVLNEEEKNKSVPYQNMTGVFMFPGKLCKEMKCDTFQSTHQQGL